MRANRLISIILILVMSLGMVPALAQFPDEATTFTFDSAAITVNAGDSGEMTVLPNSHFVDSNEWYLKEDILFTRGWMNLGVSLVSSHVPIGDWDQQSDRLMANGNLRSELLGREQAPTTGWSLWNTTYDLQFTQLMYARTAISDDANFWVVVSVMSSESSLLDDLAWIEDNVTIGENPAISESDYLNASSALDGNSAHQPVLLQRDASKPISDFYDLGLVSESEWTSPGLGLTFTWNENWQFWPDARTPLFIDEEAGFESIVLYTADHRGQVTIYVEKVRTNVPEPKMWSDAWNTEQFLRTSNPWHGETSILAAYSDETGGLISYSHSVFGHPYYIIRDVYYTPDGHMIIIAIRAAPEDIGDVYKLFWDGVMADGDFYPLTFTLEEVDALPTD